MSIFNSKETEKAFLDWVKPFNGEVVQANPADEKRFHQFAKTYHDKKEGVSKKEFVVYAKQFIPTSGTHNRGLVQEYYSRLIIVDKFLNDTKER